MLKPNISQSTVDESSIRRYKGITALWITLLLNVILAAIKLICGVIGDSEALIVDAIESLSDIFVISLNWGCFYIACVPADRDHPYGHGKAEAVAAFLVGLILTIASLIAISVAIWGLLKGPSTPQYFTVIVLLGIVVTKEILYRYIKTKSTQLTSIALEAESWHQRSDAITSAAAAIGITLALIGGSKLAIADDIAAFFGAAIIGYNASRIIKIALNQLMDSSVETSLLNQITTVASQTQGVSRVEKCIARRSGHNIFVDMHIEVDGEMSVSQAHKISHDVKDRIIDRVQHVQDVLVHIEPQSDKHKEPPSYKE